MKKCFNMKYNGYIKQLYNSRSNYNFDDVSFDHLLVLIQNLKIKM